MMETFHHSETVENVLARTLFVVEATSFEQHQLWVDHAKDSQFRGNRNYPTVDWVQINTGWVVELGELAGRPINMSVNWARIGGHLVMFWNLCSQLADYKMAEDWLDKNFHGKYDNDTRQARTDAINFGHCLAAIREADAFITEIVS